MNRERNYISIFYEILYIYIYITPIITLLVSLRCPKNTLICKLDLVHTYIVYNEKTRL